MPAGSVERFSTAQMPGRARLDFWNDLAAETFKGLVVDADDPDYFHGEMVRAPLGRLGLMSSRSAPAQVRRTNETSRADGREAAFDLHFPARRPQHEHPGRAHRRARRRRLHPLRRQPALFGCASPRPTTCCA
ncbi:MAG: hypothetical protein WDM92_16470 [Caulobacteraceae bacterium]